MKKLLSMTVLLLALLPAAARAERLTPPTWQRCTFSVSHGVVAHGSCHRYPMPKRAGQRVTGHRTVRHQGAHRLIVARIPRFYAAPKVPATSATCYRQVWWITWYDDPGLTASGRSVFSGEAAGGYDVPLGSHVTIPGVGTVVILDREGAQPFAHADVWVPSPAAAASLGLASDHRTVTVCA